MSAGTAGKAAPRGEPSAGTATVDIRRAAEALRAGELVVFPTETLYGLGCAALDAAAIERLRRVKQRPDEKGFAVVIGDVAMLERLTTRVGPAAKRLIAAFWPGPLTLLLPARDELPAALVVDGLVGVRLTSGDVAARLSRELGGPLASPSANPAGGEPARDVAAARAYFGDQVAAYLDAGRLAGAPSTLVDPGPPLRVLREGAVSRAAIERALAEPTEQRNP